MKITVLVKPNAKVEKVVKNSEDEYVVYAKEEAKASKANEAVEELISKYFNLPKIKVRIVSGFRAKKKVILVEV